MINKLQQNPKINKGLINKHKTGELRLKTQEQVETLLNYKEGKKGNNYNRVLKLIPQLSYEEFIYFLEKEIDKQHFYNKTIEYYEKLFNRLEELKSKINNKIKFKYYNNKIEQALLESSQKNDFNYFEEKIKENKIYDKIYKILNSKNITTSLLSNTDRESFLLITPYKKDKSLNTNGSLVNQLLSLNKDVHLMNVTNKKLKEIYKNESDIEKYLKGKLRGKGANNKIDTIYNNLDYDTAILLAIKNFISQDIEKSIENLIKIKNYLNGQKGNPKNSIDEKLLRAINIEIKLLKQENNNKKRIEQIIDILENNNDKNILQEALKEIKYILKTKKEKKSLEYFKFLLLGGSKKTRLAQKNYKKITQLKNIKGNIENLNNKNEIKKMVNRGNG